MEYEKIIDDFLKTEKGREFIKNKLNPEIMDRIRKESAQKSLIDMDDVVEIVSIALTGYKESGDVKESSLKAFREYHDKRAKEERNNLYELYKKNLVKWEELIQILEDMKNGKRRSDPTIIFNKIVSQCHFCYDTGDYKPTKDMSINCNYCKIDKRICDDYSKKGLINLFIQNYRKISEFSFLRKTLYFVNIILKSLKWNMDNLLLTCYHNWKWTGYGYCMDCDEFFKADKSKLWAIHGNPVVQCIKCGLIYEPENGYFTCDEIENFEFNETKIPHIEDITIRGLWIIENIKIGKRLS